MANEIFKFNIVRPHELRDIKEIEKNTIKSYFAPPNESTFHKNLIVTCGKENGRKEMIKLAHEFIKSTDFISDLNKTKTPLKNLDEWIFVKTSEMQLSDLKTEVKNIFKNEIGSEDYKRFLKSNEYKDDRRKIADSLIAASILPKLPKGIARVRPKLVRGLRLCGLLERLAEDENSLKKKGAIRKILRGIVLLPPDVFPLPSMELRKKKREELIKVYEEEKKRIEENKEETLKVAKKAEELQNTIVELTRAYDAVSLERQKEMEKARAEVKGNIAERIESIIDEKLEEKISRGIDKKIVDKKKVYKSSISPEVDKSWLLPKEVVEKISPETKNVLKEYKIPDDYVHVQKVVSKLEEEISNTVKQIAFTKPIKDIVKIGEVYIAQPKSEPEPPLITIEPVTPTFTPLEIVSVPTGSGSVNPIGMADLLIVKQEIQKYEAGEVAHIENVLQGEFKERSHRRTKVTEEIITEEAERIEETERDLQSTERFELKNNSEKTIKEDMKVEAGVQVTASYGPSVQVKADAGFSYERSKEESKKTATSYSRDVVDRSVSRIQERVREERVRRTMVEVEEINEHGVDNKEGTGHVIGIYRWVDKIYKTEIVNYGQRLMFEFIIPEPSAFFKFAVAGTPIEGITMEKPEPPGYYVGDEFVPLSPENIKPINYLYWVGKHNVSGVNLPPPMYKIIGTAFHKEIGSTTAVAESKKELQVPKGYLAKKAWVRWFGWGWDHELQVAIGKAWEESPYLNPPVLWLNDEDDIVPFAVLMSEVDKCAVSVEVSCQRTDSKLDEWKMNTFESIMTSYNELKDKYEDQLVAAQVQAGIAISGRNPLKNREIEKTELKKQSLSILTDQHFDLFDAMRDNVPYHGYPQMDIEEADAEGKYIQFFEQAFEWNNMTYLFYPYFWGRKINWVQTSQLEDTDPLFEKFLQAGSARVQVPVRPGYDEAALHYLETEGEIWEGGDPPHVEDELYVSIVDLIKEEQGVELTEGEGTISVVNGDSNVKGTGTDFDEDNDENREIIIKGVKYRISKVNSPTNIELTEEYNDADEPDIPYYLGLLFVGVPWEVKIPTSLVHLQTDSALPDWTK
jgi:hypothetical protein